MTLMAVEAERMRGVCGYWPDKWAYLTADAASRALREHAGNLPPRYDPTRDGLSAYECCDRAIVRHWHVGRLHREGLGS